jgi:hypothetical protein
MGMRQEQSGVDAPAFWVVVVDHRAMVFAVFGPICRDDQWIKMVAGAREKGWDMTLCTVGSKLDAKMTAHDLADSGFAEKEDNILERLGWTTQVTAAVVPSVGRTPQ